MNYTESLAYLDSLGKFGIKLGMELSLIHI